MPAATDPRTLVVSLHRRGVALELQSIDLCFLAALHLRAEQQGLASYKEDALFDVFQDVVALTKDASTDGNKRATHVLRRLRDQKLLVRVDGAGVVRSGEYALTRLATAIVTFYLADEALTRESLGVLASTLNACLTDIRDAACSADTVEAWRKCVENPLRVTLFELASGIERRQRGFDLEQEDFQREIAAVLAADWFGAIERCTALLDATAATLSELNDMLMHHAHAFSVLLQEVEERAADAGQEGAERAAREALDHVERIAGWGAARQRAWSDYHEWVHRYLRDVVRLDPSRTLVHRLREQLTGRAGKAYALTVAHGPPIRLLRDVAAAPVALPVGRPKKERETKLESDTTSDPDAALETSVVEAIAAGARGLADVTARVVAADVDPDVRFRTAGKVAQILARIAPVELAHERPWVPAGEGLVLEEWSVVDEESP